MSGTARDGTVVSTRVQDCVRQRRVDCVLGPYVERIFEGGCCALTAGLLRMVNDFAGFCCRCVGRHKEDKKAERT